jgi:hypothetical protein
MGLCVSSYPFSFFFKIKVFVGFPLLQQRVSEDWSILLLIQVLHWSSSSTPIFEQRCDGSLDREVQSCSKSKC